MATTRVPFDPAGPFEVAVEQLVAGPGRLRRGEPFPVAGFSPLELLQMWTCMQIDVAPTSIKPADVALDLSSLSPDELADLEAATAPPPMATVDARAPAAAIATAEQPRAPSSSRAGRRRG